MNSNVTPENNKIKRELNWASQTLCRAQSVTEPEHYVKMNTIPFFPLAKKSQISINEEFS